MTTVITEFSAHIITMFLVTFNHNAPCPFITMLQKSFSSQCSLTASSQCSMAVISTMLQNSCHQNVPYRVITMLHGRHQHNAPEFLSSQCSMAVSSQCSMALVSTMLQKSCHQNVPYRVITMLHGHCHHNAPEFLSSQYSDRKSVV